MRTYLEKTQRKKRGRRREVVVLWQRSRSRRGMERRRLLGGMGLCSSRSCPAPCQSWLNPLRIKKPVGVPTIKATSVIQDTAVDGLSAATTTVNSGGSGWCGPSSSS
jgi:hypothetical protein